MTLLDWIIIVFFILAMTVWLAYEMWAAPLVDDNYKIITPGKTIKDLFKKKNK